MPQMCVTNAAFHFHPNHSIRNVFRILDNVLFYRLSKTGPARPRIEFYVGVEEFGIAADTIVLPRVIAAAKLARKTCFRPPLARDPKLLRRQDRLPFRICLFDPPVGG